MTAIEGKKASSIQKAGSDVIVKVGYDKNMTDDERAAFSASVKESLTTALEGRFGAPVVDNENQNTEAAAEATAAPETTAAPDEAAAAEATALPSATPDSLEATSRGTLTSGVRLKSLDDISPSSGQELARSAMWMALLACAGILVYVTIRFEFTSGCVAIIALVHDVLILLGVYSLFRISVNINFIGGGADCSWLLNNNTIVIMDRTVRIHVIPEKKHMGEIANNSIWQTMTRSINTTITTLLTIGMVYKIGVSAIKAFALPIIIGIVVGFFSSVFVTGPLWATWRDSAVKAKKANSASKAGAKKSK